MNRIWLDSESTLHDVEEHLEVVEVHQCLVQLTLNSAACLGME